MSQTAKPPQNGWFKSSFSGSNNCVLIRHGDDVWLRDSKDSAGPVLSFTRAEWTAFLQGVRAGEFDLPLRSPVEADEAR